MDIKPFNNMMERIMGFYGPAGPGGFRRRGRRRGLVVGAAAGAAVARHASNNSSDAPAPESAEAEADPANDYTSQLTELMHLKTQNLITEEEYETKRKQILKIS